MATIRDIAREAGVGLGTVSRALNGNGYVSAENKKKISEAVQKLGYTSLKSNRSNNMQSNSGIIGIILPDVSLPFYGMFLKYAEMELGNRGYKTMVFNTLGVQGRVLEAIEMAENKILDGLILNADINEMENSRLANISVVSFERMIGNGIPFVSSEHREGGLMAAKVFLECGCKNILIITAKHETKVYGDYRITECKKALEKAGIGVVVVEFSSLFISYRYIQEIVEQYMSIYNRIDGIFSDDMVAYCCLMEAKKRKISVPRDMKIIGYDGNEITQMAVPQVTTIKQNVSLLASTCIDVVLSRIQGERVDERYLIPVEFVRGGTCK